MFPPGMTQMEKAVPHWCHFVWVVFRCDFEACGCWQGRTDLCWHGVVSSLRGDKLTWGGVGRGNGDIMCTLNTTQDKEFFVLFYFHYSFGFFHILPGEYDHLTSVLPATLIAGPSRGLCALYLHPERMHSLPWFPRPSLPSPTFPSLNQCVTNQGTGSQAVCLQSDKKDGAEGGRREGSRGSEGETFWKYQQIGFSW